MIKEPILSLMRENVAKNHSSRILASLKLYQYFNFKDYTLYNALIESAASGISKKTIERIVKKSNKSIDKCDDSDIIAAFGLPKNHIQVIFVSFLVTNRNACELFNLSKVLNENKIHTSSIYSIACSPNGELFISCDGSNKIDIWNFNNGTLITSVINDSGKSFSSVAYNPNAQEFALGSHKKDGIIQIQDAKTGEKIKTLVGHTNFVYTLMYNDDGKYLASASTDGTIKIWDVGQGAVIHSIPNNQKSIAIAYSPNGKHLAYTTDNGTVKIWELGNKEEISLSISDSNNVVTAITYSSNGEYLACGLADGSIKVWKIKENTLQHTFSGQKKPINYIVYSADNNYLISASYGNTINVWDTPTGKNIQTITSNVISIAYNVPQQGFISGSDRDDGSIKIWKIKSLAELIQEINAILNEKQTY